MGGELNTRLVASEGTAIHSSRLKRRSMASHTRHSASGSVVLGSIGSVWLSVRGKVGSCRPVQHSYLNARRHATLIVCMWL
jgi:hypothetical protein